ncbi:MAG: methyltransferase domain-containing protein, partial [Acetobacteraceae bacterium]|nr:methyltransferase domain-containing protein [Acetobacteraceae bacterium]
VADALIRSFAPRRVFDAGCAMGFLVESLWDRGVEACGRDISAWAISQVRADVRPWCEVGSIADPVEGRYDLIACIEVLEHMPEAEAARAIQVLAAAAPRILFSSSPTDLDEPTHINVRPPLYWLTLWAEAGFAPSVTHDAGYLAPHAYILERSEEGRSPRELIAFADRVRHRVALSQVGANLAEAERELANVRSVSKALEEAETELTLARRELEAAGVSRAEALACAAAAEAARVRAEHEIEAVRRSAGAVHTELQAVLNSTTWRATGALRRGAHFIPAPLRRVMRRGLRRLGSAATLRLPGDRRTVHIPDAPALAAAHPVLGVSSDLGLRPSVDTLLGQHFAQLSALPVFAVPHLGGRRLTVVTDSINGGSLYGGVGTALILAALAASRIGADLRVVTRTEPPDAANIGTVLDLHQIAWDRSVECLYAPGAGESAGGDVPASPDDLFLTTSWWTTWSTRESIPRARIAYLLQEDERMFYALGDEHLRCTETLSDNDLLYLVNSELLLAHLRDEGLAPGAVAFEPAFPEHVYQPAPAGPPVVNGKRAFFFYARPNNPRNLYWRGLEALCAAIEEDVLAPPEWDFHFAGQGGDPFVLPRGARAFFHEPMPWPEYAKLIRRIDVGLSLMYTPHPSYPPLDIAASGGVVVTSRFGRKRDLDRYCQNILCADTDVPSLVIALRNATSLAGNPEVRSANFARSGLQRDWVVSMSPALNRLVSWAGG